jgi:TonB family protein
MKCSILLLFVWISQFVLAQQRDPSIILYDKGNAAVASKDYRTADSLFTLSLNIAPHPDSYYNRAVCRRQLKDFKGYCLDLNSASLFGDKEASNLYSRQCIKLDTVYKKNGEKVDKTDFEYVEFITSYKYNTDFEYSKHDTSGICILSKTRVDNILYYTDCIEVTNSMYKGEIDSLINYIKTQTDFNKIIIKNDFSGNIFLVLKTDESGKVIEVKSSSFKKDEGINELIHILSNMPNWEPAIYNSKPVKFLYHLYVKYYGEVIEIRDIKADINNGSEFFSVVEKMPEFPGGPMEMMRFMQKTITYPQAAKEAGASGKCFLKFVINSDGTISDIQVVKGVEKCPACDTEAIRVVKAMPKWSPGMQNGKAVNVFFNLPINFQLR